MKDDFKGWTDLIDIEALYSTVSKRQTIKTIKT